jgi:hypothetical protein
MGGGKGERLFSTSIIGESCHKAFGADQRRSAGIHLSEAAD